jgi:hypothetical protein
MENPAYQLQQARTGRNQAIKMLCDLLGGEAALSQQIKMAITDLERADREIGYLNRELEITPRHISAGSELNGNIAKTMGDLVTPKQLTAIRAIANAHGLNAERECLAKMHCRPEELSRRSASNFIDLLKSNQVSAVAQLAG